MTERLLTLSGLTVTIGHNRILDDVSLTVSPGEVHALVGESGSGKSMTALSIMGLLPASARATGMIDFGGDNILVLDEQRLCALRGDDIGMVFQEPMTALNPVKTIGEQVAEGIRFHTGANRADAERRAMAMLDRVGLPPAKFPLSRYPHQLSGGQRQRVVIAIACALNPRLLIADEPTTALDVVLQAQILDLLRDIIADNKSGLLLISHDLGVVADMADRVTILRKGTVQESGTTDTILRRPGHAYTRALAAASTHVPAWNNAKAPPSQTGLLDARDLVKTYRGKRPSMFRPAQPFRAVDGVSFSIPEGRSVGIVGRSGCGKSTLARMVLALEPVSEGKITFSGISTTTADATALRQMRRDMQVVFQDPYGSFNPRMTVERVVAEPLHALGHSIARDERRERVAKALHEVAMPADAMRRYPHEFSGGQRQRLAIARALITRPKLIVCDEPVSALDVSIQAQILDLFARLNDELGIAYLFITHDLKVARAITHETMVMADGKIVERGNTQSLLDDPQSDAARALVAAAPDLKRALSRRFGA